MNFSFSTQFIDFDCIVSDGKICFGIYSTPCQFHRPQLVRLMPQNLVNISLLTTQSWECFQAQYLLRFMKTKYLMWNLFEIFSFQILIL